MRIMFVRCLLQGLGEPLDRPVQPGHHPHQSRQDLICVQVHLHPGACDNK